MFAKITRRHLPLVALACLFSAPSMAQDNAPPQGMGQQPMPAQQPSMPMMGNPYGGMPMMPPRHYGQGMPMQRGGMGGCAQGGKPGHEMRQQRQQMMQAHRKQMEERMARIESLLEQLVEQKQKTAE
jgi:hypothetical protein